VIFSSFFRLYYVFDAAPVCLAVAILLWFNPADFLPKDYGTLIKFHEERDVEMISQA